MSSPSDDGIHGAHFVKMNFLRRFSVQPPFHLCNAAKDFERTLLNCRRKCAGIEQFLDMPKVPMRLLLRYNHFDAGSHKSPSQYPRPLEFVRTKGDFREFTQQPVGWQAGVEHGGKKHIAADAR